jgi:hypothetical protein
MSALCQKRTLGLLYSTTSFGDPKDRLRHHKAEPFSCQGMGGMESFPASFFFETRNKPASFGFCEQTYWGWGCLPASS